MQQQDGVRNIAWSARAGSSRHASPVTPLWQARSCRIPTFMKVSVLSSTAIAAACIAGSLGAQEPDTAPKPAATLRSIEAQLKSKAEEEARLIEEAAARAREIQSLRYRLIETANTIQDSEREIARIETELVRLSAEEMDAEADLRAEQATLSEVLAALQAFELSQPPALLVSPDDANEAARAALLLSEAAPALAEKASRLRETVERLSAARDALARERQNYVDTANALAARRQVLTETLSEAERKRDVAERLATAAQKETAQLAARATSLKGVVDRLQRFSYSITPRIKPPRKSPPSEMAAGAGAGAGIAIIPKPKPDEAPTLAAAPDRPTITRQTRTAPYKPARSFAKAKGALRPPVVGDLVSRFGEADAEGARFDGIRIAVRDQAIVTAPYEARVVFAQRWGPTGNMIVLDVGDGYHILLMGLGNFLIDAGQSVNAGQPIAQMTENARTLDLQIRKDGEPVDPGAWFDTKQKVARTIAESAS